MDILHPTAPALPRHEVSHGQAAIDDAEKTLHDFKKVFKEVEEEATNVYKAARDMLKEALDFCREGHMKHESESLRKAKQLNLAIEHSDKWDDLEALAETVKAKIEGPYKLVMASKENIIRAGTKESVFGSRSPDQKLAHKVYEYKLKLNFENAARDYHKICSYPDGLCAQVHLLKSKAMHQLNPNIDE